MAMMVLYFVQIGIAKDMGQCGKEDDHGFDDAGFNSALGDVFTLDFDVEKLSRHYVSSNPFFNFIAKTLSVFGQSEEDATAN